jgi:glycosyltransferase involved in cell wall biosynthesis
VFAPVSDAQPVPVTFVASHALLGGSERYLELLLDALGPGWAGRVVSLQEGIAVDRLRELGHTVEVIPTGRRGGLLTGAWRLRRALLRERPPVVHANGVKAALVAALALVGTGIPVLWVKHDFSWDGPLGRLIAAGCAEVVGVSAAVLEALRHGRPRGLPRPRLAVVANGIPVPELDPAAERARVRGELGIPADAPLVALVGRLHPAKGQIELIEAAPALIAAVPDARIALIGGDDPNQAEYAARVRARLDELGLAGRAVLTGHRGDATAVIAAADALAVPSVRDERGMGREGFGLAGIEALAVGTPVVGYGDGALPEVLGDAALLVAPGDRAALAAALAEVLGAPGRRAELAQRGRDRFAARYRIDITAAAMRARYRGLVTGGRSRAPIPPGSIPTSTARSAGATRRSTSQKTTG